MELLQQENQSAYSYLLAIPKRLQTRAYQPYPKYGHKDIREKTGWNTRDNVKKLLDWWGWTVPLRKRGLRLMDVEEEIGCEMRAGEALMRMFECKAPEQRI